MSNSLKFMFFKKRVGGASAVAPRWRPEKSICRCRYSFQACFSRIGIYTAMMAHTMPVIARRSGQAGRVRVGGCPAMAPPKSILAVAGGMLVGGCPAIEILPFKVYFQLADII